jgi:hypothetical protein
MAKSALYVGFGAGLRDPNFTRFRSWLRRVGATMPYRHYRLVLAGDAEAVRRDHDADERVMVLPYGISHAELVPFLRKLAPPGAGLSVPVPLPFDKTSSTRLGPPPPPGSTGEPGEWCRYDELGHLEQELDQRMVGEFTLLDVLKRAAADHADWSKRSARNLLHTLQRRAADLVDERELEDLYWWLHVYGVLRFTGIDRWWHRRHDWEHSVDHAEIAPRGKHLLNALAARSAIAKDR